MKHMIVYDKDIFNGVLLSNLSDEEAIKKFDEEVKDEEENILFNSIELVKIDVIKSYEREREEENGEERKIGA